MILPKKTILWLTWIFCRIESSSARLRRLIMATYAAYKHVELYNVGSGKRRWISSFFLFRTLKSTWRESTTFLTLYCTHWPLQVRVSPPFCSSFSQCRHIRQRNQYEQLIHFQPADGNLYESWIFRFLLKISDFFGYSLLSAWSQNSSHLLSLNYIAKNFYAKLNFLHFSWYLLKLI